MEQHFLNAVRVLYHPHTNPQQRQEANQWLQAFQKADEGWRVSMHLMNAPEQLDPGVQAMVAQVKTAAISATDPCTILDTCAHIRVHLHVLRTAPLLPSSFTDPQSQGQDMPFCRPGPVLPAAGSAAAASAAETTDDITGK